MSDTTVLIITDALFLSGVYAMIALGLTIVYSSTKVINFAQGEFFVGGAAVAYWLQSVHSAPTWLAILAVLAVGAGLGLITEVAALGPVRRSGLGFGWIIATLALALILENAYNLLFPNATLRAPPMVDGKVGVFGADVPGQEFIFVGVAIVVLSGYLIALKRTTLGRVIRATAHDPETTATMGVGVRGVVIGSFAISGMITALAGYLSSSSLTIAPTSGLTFAINGFVAMVIGGVGSPAGAVLGGLIVGLLNSLVGNLISADLSQVFTVLTLAIILVIRPTGILGRPIAAH